MYGPCEDKSTELVGDFISGPIVALVNGSWHPVFFFYPRLRTLHVLVQQVAQPKR
jgi:hypothetical protein